MDNIGTDSAEAGTGGPEGDTGNGVNVAAIVEPIAGAIDPDAARNAGAEVGTDDFAASFANAEPVPRIGKRGKRGPNKRTTEKENAAPLSINGVEKILFSLHAMASIAVPELMLEEKEAKRLASAIEGVTDQYKVSLDPKVAAYIDLATACGMIYGPRAVAFYVRKQGEKQKPVQQRPTAVVTPLRPENMTAPMTSARPGADPMAFDPANMGKPLGA